MRSNESEPNRAPHGVLLGRRFLTCRGCGWVHYVMTAEEKATNDRVLERYQFSEAERLVYESAFRQCLRCEAPAREFRAAEELDLTQAEGHLVTPVFVEIEVGTN